MLKLPVVLRLSALRPMAVFRPPMVLFESALAPMAAQRNAFRRRDVYLQQRVFAPRNPRFGLAAMEFRLKVDYENIKLRFT